jgi:hypothetical protein
LPHIRTPFNHKEFNLTQSREANLNNSTYTLLNSLNLNSLTSQTNGHLNENSQSTYQNPNTASFLEPPNKSLHSSYSCHELSIKQSHQNGTTNSVQSGFHFHLAGFIDPEAGKY